MIKSVIRHICHLPESVDQFWDIYDQFNNTLFLIHTNNNYTPDNPNLSSLHSIRGIIIDVSSQKIIVQSVGNYHVTQIYNTLKILDQNLIVSTDISLYNSINDTITSIIGDQIFENFKLYLGYEGIIIRIWWYDQTMFFSTLKKINASNSMWQSKTTFLQLYTQLGGPDVTTLNPSQCHFFIISHNSLKLCSSTTHNSLIYLNNQSAISVDLANKYLFPKLLCHNDVNLLDNELKIIYNSDNTPIDIIANIYPSNDERLDGGDFVILHTGNTYYQLNSIGYQYRYIISNNDPNFYHRFIIGMSKFIELSSNQIYKNYPKYIRNDKLLPAKTITDRQIYWWSIYYDVVPPHIKSSADLFLQTYINNIHTLSNLIITNPQSFPPHLSDKIYQLKNSSKYSNLILTLFKYSGNLMYPMLKYINSPQYNIINIKKNIVLI